MRSRGFEFQRQVRSHGMRIGFLARASRAAYHKPLTMHQRRRGLSRVRRRAERRATRL
jgi:hypothetical protein